MSYFTKILLINCMENIKKVQRNIKISQIFRNAINFFYPSHNIILKYQRNIDNICHFSLFIYCVYIHLQPTNYFIYNKKVYSMTHILSNNQYSRT